MDSCVILELPHEGHPWWKCTGTNVVTYSQHFDLAQERRMDSCVILELPHEGHSIWPKRRIGFLCQGKVSQFRVHSPVQLNTLDLIPSDPIHFFHIFFVG